MSCTPSVSIYSTGEKGLNVKQPADINVCLNSVCWFSEMGCVKLDFFLGFHHVLCTGYVPAVIGTCRLFLAILKMMIHRLKEYLVNWFGIKLPEFFCSLYLYTSICNYNNKNRST